VQARQTRTNSAKHSINSLVAVQDISKSGEAEGGEIVKGQRIEYGMAFLNFLKKKLAF